MRTGSGQLRPVRAPSVPVLLCAPFSPCDRVEHVAVDRSDAACSRGRRTGGIEFDAMQLSFGQLMKRCAGADAGIDSAEPGSEIKQAP